MVRCGRMCPILLITNAVKTKSRETMGKGVAVRTISEEKKGGLVEGVCDMNKNEENS